MDSYRQEPPRATAWDWTRAITCSLLILLLLLWLLLRPTPHAEPGVAGGPGSGTGIEGTGPGGLGEGEGPGMGDGAGLGDEGKGRGNEDSGSAGGTNENRDTIGGAIVAEEAETVAPGEVAASNAETSVSVEEMPTGTVPEETSEAVEELLAQANTADDRIVTIAPGAQAPPPAPASPVLGGDGTSGPRGGSDRGKDVGGMMVKGSRLGVVLDVSGSMAPYLDDLRAEIRRQFSSAVFLEVSGCSLRPSRFDAQEFREDPPEDAKRNGVMDAFQELVQHHGVDSIYWFCDLQDPRNDEALAELRSLVWGREMSPLAVERVPGATSGFSGLDQLEELQNNVSTRQAENPSVHLYVRSTGETPDPVLRKIIEESGGRFQKKR